jgi:hypothetical protein
MSYTYPQALDALQSIANDYMKMLRPSVVVPVRLVCDVNAATASVTWDHYEVRINMPVRPAASIMLQSEFEDWTAYVLHEMGHPTHTDKAAWHDAVRAGVARMVNALEDVRMEQALIASGIVPNARAVLSRLISRKVAEARTGQWKPNARAEFGWTICVLGRAANGYTIDAADLAWIKSQIKAGGTVSAVMAWAMPALAACASTADCVALAKRIMAALAVPQVGPIDVNPGNGEAGEAAGEAGEAAGEAGEAGEGNEAGENERAGEASEGEGEAGEGEGEAGEGEAGEGEGEGEAGEGEGEGEGEAGEGERKGENSDSAGDSDAGKGGQGHGDGTTDADETPIDSEDDLAEDRSLAPEGETVPNTGEYGSPANTEKAVIDILRGNVIGSRPRDTGTARMGANGVRMKDAAAKASKQRALLARALRANETDEREGGRKSGRLDRGALARASAGAASVFERRDIAEGFDTDVCVLLDASGSMGGYNLITALETGLVISQAAASVGAACTTEIFNSQGYIRAGSLASKRTPNAAEFGALQNAATGGTPLSPHMARVAVNQAKRAPQKRRVVFVVTDGGCDHGPHVVKRMAGYLEKTFGTVLAHVSIGTPLAGSFKAEVMVPVGTPFAEIGLDHFVKVLQAL